MKKVALISINKNPTDEERKAVHRLLSTETVYVEKIPSIGSLFNPDTESGKHRFFHCLRVEDKNKSLDSIDGHDVIIYAEFSYLQ